MGKVRRLRKKLHASAKEENKPKETFASTVEGNASLPIDLPSNDLFKNINFNFDFLKKSLPADDIQSVKSLKSLKSEAGGNKTLRKKDKLALRRAQLLRKIDTVNQLKKERKLREKRKKTAIIGDTNPLRDALPSLESLFKSKDNVNVPYKDSKQDKPKGIAKAKTRKKKMVQDMVVYKQILSNKVFQKNPMGAISEHIKHLVQQEEQNSKK